MKIIIVVRWCESDTEKEGRSQTVFLWQITDELFLKSHFLENFKTNSPCNVFAN